MKKKGGTLSRLFKNVHASVGQLPFFAKRIKKATLGF